jgi:chaperonin GroES
MKLKALHDFVIVRPAGGESKSEGGIVLPAQNGDKRSAIRGEVIAVGPGKFSDTGELLPMTVKVGDKVLYDNNRAQPFSAYNEVFYLMPQGVCFATDNE